MATTRPVEPSTWSQEGPFWPNNINTHACDDHLAGGSDYLPKERGHGSGTARCRTLEDEVSRSSTIKYTAGKYGLMRLYTIKGG